MSWLAYWLRLALCFAGEGASASAKIRRQDLVVAFGLEELMEEEAAAAVGLQPGRQPPRGTATATPGRKRR